MTFLRYNANKALMNLGQDPLFPDSANDVNPIVMNGISTYILSSSDFVYTLNSYYLSIAIQEGIARIAKFYGCCWIVNKVIIKI